MATQKETETRVIVSYQHQKDTSILKDQDGNEVNAFFIYFSFTVGSFEITRSSFTFMMNFKINNDWNLNVAVNFILQIAY